MKFLLLIAIFSFSAFANINFTETRYMSAIDVERKLTGTIKLKADIMTVTYIKPNKKIITYYSDKITITNESDEIKEYSFIDYPQAQYMGLILKAILNDDYTSLDELFKIKKEKEEITLKAKPIIYNTMEDIIIIKNESVIKKITIHMTNKDKITIETIN